MLPLKTSAELGAIEGEHMYDTSAAVIIHNEDVYSIKRIKCGCNNCRETFDSNNMQQEHVQQYRQCKGVERKRIVLKSLLKKYTYNHRFHVLNTEMCAFCEKPFSSKLRLGMHIRNVHNIEKETMEVKAKAEKCSVKLQLKPDDQKIDAKFSRNLFGKQISQEFRKPKFFCQTCDQKFATKDVMDQHNIDDHGHSAQHVCDKCDKDFASKLRLYKHSFLDPDHTPCLQ